MGRRDLTRLFLYIGSSPLNLGEQINASLVEMNEIKRNYFISSFYLSKSIYLSTSFYNFLFIPSIYKLYQLQIDTLSHFILIQIYFNYFQLYFNSKLIYNSFNIYFNYVLFISHLWGQRTNPTIVHRTSKLQKISSRYPIL